MNGQASVLSRHPRALALITTCVETRPKQSSVSSQQATQEQLTLFLVTYDLGRTIAKGASLMY